MHLWQCSKLINILKGEATFWLPLATGFSSVLDQMKAFQVLHCQSSHSPRISLLQWSLYKTSYPLSPSAPHTIFNQASTTPVSLMHLIEWAGFAIYLKDRLREISLYETTLTSRQLINSQHFNMITAVEVWKMIQLLCSTLSSLTTWNFLWIEHLHWFELCGATPATRESFSFSAGFGSCLSFRSWRGSAGASTRLAQRHGSLQPRGWSWLSNAAPRGQSSKSTG